MALVATTFHYRYGFHSNHRRIKRHTLNCLKDYCYCYCYCKCITIHDVVHNFYTTTIIYMMHIDTLICLKLL